MGWTTLIALTLATVLVGVIFWRSLAATSSGDASRETSSPENRAAPEKSQTRPLRRHTPDGPRRFSPSSRKRTASPPRWPRSASDSCSEERC
jgi:hypothetical protein